MTPPVADDPDGRAAAVPPEHPSLDDLVRAAAGCRACGLWEQATQTVFGEGGAEAAMMLVGEQPGDMEDRRGAPFVGPAGRILDQALAAAGIPRERTYVTNVVKHFKWTQRGKRRLHQRPNAAEQAACRPWLDAELAVVRPDVLVLLGATAAQALLGSGFRVSRARGRFVESPLAPRVLATVHPSSILRGGTDQRQAALQGLVDDLAVAAGALP
ncbi:MAG TPA: UdgX family uracil-DNA binding protein [Acidimicrobiales bacterium]|nr:UdgX family uracil-DNA binding protein [Acidimicrobiales bacterium]